MAAINRQREATLKKMFAEAGCDDHSTFPHRQ
jgi:hypothetical protein